jgi:hypothetical protein
MLERYVAFSAADRFFYEPMERLADSPSRFDAARRSAPPGWTRTERDVWVALSPMGVKLPRQGWKVHVSVELAHASAVIDQVWEYCVANGISFKFLRSGDIYLMGNAKYASRTSSGKLAALYPVSVAQLHSILDDLSVTLKRYSGPYILSDLRWGAGPLYIRYGGFVERYCASATGEPVPAVERTDDGALVPDERGPVFGIPEWAPVPGFIADAVEAFDTDDGPALPYEVEEALHFSNSGGIYRARDPRTGRTVVLREARPGAGLDHAGNDAVSRLTRARMILEELAGLDFVPQLLADFTSWGHHFLVEEYITGETLRQYMVRCNPSVRPDPSAAELQAYTESILGILSQLDHALAVLHARGIVFGDLQLQNIIVRPDGRIVLIDFETAFHPESDPVPTIATYGFSSPEHRTGVAIDSYAMDCLRLAVFLPLTEMLDHDPGKAGQLADSAAELFGLPAGYTRHLRMGLARRSAPTNRDAIERFGQDLVTGTSYPGLRAALVAAITASATPARTDRLFPGDVDQYPYGGHTLAHGAAGVLYALRACGAAADPEHVQWLVDAAGRARFPRPGLYDGLHGTGYVLHRLGRSGEALNVIDHAIGLVKQDGRTTVGLFSGLSGIALVLLRLARATGDSSLRTVAVELADRTAQAVRAGDDASGVMPHVGVGLLRGCSGPALLFLDLYTDTGDRGFLDLAATALDRDLLHCEIAGDGSVNLHDDRNRLLPYLGEGSAGVGLALHAYLQHRDDERLRSLLAGIRRAARIPFTIQPGLFRGRAGLITFLSQAGVAADADAVRMHLRHLSWHAAPFAEGVSFAGENLLRLSMDLGTGTAGVLLAIASAVGNITDALPPIGIGGAVISGREGGEFNVEATQATGHAHRETRASVSAA